MSLSLAKSIHCEKTLAHWQIATIPQYKFVDFVVVNIKINSLYRVRKIGRSYQSVKTVLASFIANVIVDLFYHTQRMPPTIYRGFVKSRDNCPLMS